MLQRSKPILKCIITFSFKSNQCSGFWRPEGGDEMLNCGSYFTAKRLQVSFGSTFYIMLIDINYPTFNIMFIDIN